MKYGTHKWEAYPGKSIPDMFGGTFYCTFCGLIVKKHYLRSPLWRVKNKNQFFDHRDIRIPKSCAEIIMDDALD